MGYSVWVQIPPRAPKRCGKRLQEPLSAFFFAGRAERTAKLQDPLLGGPVRGWRRAKGRPRKIATPSGLRGESRRTFSAALGSAGPWMSGCKHGILGRRVPLLALLACRGPSLRTLKVTQIAPRRCRRASVESEKYRRDQARTLRYDRGG